MNVKFKLEFENADGKKTKDGAVQLTVLTPKKHVGVDEVGNDKIITTFEVAARHRGVQSGTHFELSLGQRLIVSVEGDPA